MKKIKRFVEISKISIWLFMQTVRHAKNKEIFRMIFAEAWGVEWKNVVLKDNLTLWEFSTYLYNEGYVLDMRK